MTTVSDRLFHMGGVPVGGPMTQGNVYHVKPYDGDDTYNDGLSPERAFKTLAKALSTATANQNDIVYLYAQSNTAANTTDYQSATLDWNKDGVHLIGVGSGAMIGQRSRVAFISTYTTASNLFTLSADNCYIANIEFFAGVASANPLGAMLVTGTRNVVENCQISGVGHASMDIAAGYSLKIINPAAENLFRHCYIGLDTIIRATCKHEVWLLGSAGNEIPRTIFEDCFIESYTSATDFKLVDANYIDRFLLFKNCTFNAVKNITSAASPTGAIKNTTPNGSIILQNSYVFGCDNVTTANDDKTWVAGAAPAVDSCLGGTVTIS